MTAEQIEYVKRELGLSDKEVAQILEAMEEQ